MNLILDKDFKSLDVVEQLVFQIVELEHTINAKREWLNQFAKDEASKFSNTNLFPNLDLGIEYGEELYDYVEALNDQKNLAKELHLDYHFPLQTYVRVDDGTLLLMQQQVNPRGQAEIVAFVKQYPIEDA